MTYYIEKLIMRYLLIFLLCFIMGCSYGYTRYDVNLHLKDGTTVEYNDAEHCNMYRDEIIVYPKTGCLSLQHQYSKDIIESWEIIEYRTSKRPNLNDK